ncbi:MAG TPA: hypothetical protein VLT36_02880, partial [Candidatus Dormibacteraeota bacterium]|nr:hypothetical protein [Candidatus Dormibacteraeota bacterium]
KSDYDTPLKDPLMPRGYPGFIQSRDLLSKEAQAKLGVQVNAWLKTTLSYQWLQNHYRTATGPADDQIGKLQGLASPGGSLLAGRYDSQLVSLNATLTPWRRLFLSATFTFQNARTQTDANNSPSVAPYDGNIYSLLLNGTYALNEKTDLVAAYSFSAADFAQDNLAQGLPLGTRYHEHAVQAGYNRKIGKGKSIGVQYRYYSYADAAVGGASDFSAHAIFATFAWRLP